MFFFDGDLIQKKQPPGENQQPPKKACKRERHCYFSNDRGSIARMANVAVRAMVHGQEWLSILIEVMREIGVGPDLPDGDDEIERDPGDLQSGTCQPGGKLPVAIVEEDD